MGPVYGEFCTWKYPSPREEQRELYIEGCDISPDLSQIAYNTVAALQISQVKLVATLGGQSSAIADSATDVFWTPDGKRLGYMRIGRGLWPQAPSGSGKLEIWSVKPDGSNRRLELLDSVTTGMTVSFAWSPNMKSIAWVRTYPEGYQEVMVREVATGKEQELTHDRKTADEVSWAANGQIIFISNKSGQANLWMVPARGGEATEITQGTAPIISARISTDEKKILYLQKEYIRPVWTSSIDGSRPRQVTTDEVQVSSTVFSPDGQSIAAEIGDVDLFTQEKLLSVMDRQGKNRRVLSSGAGFGLASWSPDGKWLAYGNSGKVYLTQPANPGTPRLLCEGEVIRWMGSEDVSVWRAMKTYHYSLRHGLVGQLAPESLYVFAQVGSNRILYQDYREGSMGWWIGSLSSVGREPVGARRVAALDSVASWAASMVARAISPDMRFALFQKATAPWEGIWRLSLTDGKEERVGTVPAPWMFIQSITRDGKELLWVKVDDRAKLSLIDHPFE